MDPFAGINHDPQSLHKYAYAHCDPVNGIDPSGLYLYDLQLVHAAAMTSVNPILFSSSLKSELLDRISVRNLAQVALALAQSLRPNVKRDDNLSGEITKAEAFATVIGVLAPHRHIFFRILIQISIPVMFRDRFERFGPSPVRFLFATSLDDIWEHEDDLGGWKPPLQGNDKTITHFSFHAYWTSVLGFNPGRYTVEYSEDHVADWWANELGTRFGKNLPADPVNWVLDNMVAE